MGELWFCGDTHGDLDHIIEHVLAAHAGGLAPAAIILLGDIDAPRPLHIELEAVRCLTEIYWIPGNHDGDDNAAWNNLVSSELSDANLHCQVSEIASWRVAGLGGVFRKKIWCPPDEPRFASYESWRTELMVRRPPQAWGISETADERRHKTSIFPECVAELGKLRADILVSHEAPECRDDGRGWAAIGDLARRVGARFAFHGHHHDRQDYSDHFTDLGFQAYAVGYRGISSLSRDGTVAVIRPGYYDEIGGLRWEGDDE